MLCPNCYSSHVQKRGVRGTVSGKSFQQYYCHDCRRFFSEGEIPEDKFPAVLSMDIETLPIKAYVWKVWEENIAPKQIIEDWCVLSWSAKWFGDDKMISEVLTPEEALRRDDKRILKDIWNLFDEADVVIAQNGKKFDFRKLNSRWWKYRMGPPSSYKVIDTLEAARIAFGQTFNNLDSLADYMGLGHKIHTEFELWRDCDLGIKEALTNMREYNEQDVALLEDVYVSMRPFIPNHPNFAAYEKVDGVCPRCFGPYESIGYYQAAVQRYKEYRCRQCGAVFHATRPEKR